jgi:hypothetical protein
MLEPKQIIEFSDSELPAVAILDDWATPGWYIIAHLGTRVPFEEGDIPIKAGKWTVLFSWAYSTVPAVVLGGATVIGRLSLREQEDSLAVLQHQLFGEPMPWHLRRPVLAERDPRHKILDADHRRAQVFTALAFAWQEGQGYLVN